MIEHISNFNKLPVWAQAEALEKGATLLASRMHQGWEVKLYALDQYYVELWQKQALKVTTTFRTTAKAMDIMEPYMDSIQLQDQLRYW